MENLAWLINYPSRGEYNPDCLRLEKREVPVIGDNEVLVRTLLISLDPTSRNWLKLEPSSTFLPLAVGDVMIGQAVGVVEKSSSSNFASGDLVRGMWGWANFSIANPMYIEKIPKSSGVPLEAYLSVFSHVGRAAAIGLFEVGNIKSSDVVVVSGAAGATGSLAALMAKAQGCRVIGIAGSVEKIDQLINDFGLDAAINYKVENVSEALARYCPAGIDLYFDNVGGEILDAVLTNMAVGCRIAVCGAMSQYDLANEASAYGCKNLPEVLFRRASIQGYVVPDFMEDIAKIDSILEGFYKSGKISSRAHVVEGIESASEALRHILHGTNQGKLMVRVASIS